MKVYIKDSRLIFGKYEIPTGHYIIEWDQYVGETPTSFRFLSAGSNSPLPIFLSTFVNIKDCQYENGTYYTGYTDFIAAIGSFFVRALTVAEGELDTRITNLEENDTIYQLFQYVGTSTSGQITIPTEAEIYDFYADAIVDAILVKADANQNPTTELSVNSNSDVIHVTTLSSTGAYTLSSTPNAAACIIYYIIITDEFKSNVPYSSIISEEKRVLSAPYADFEKLAAAPAHKIGRVYYDDVAKALSYYTHIPNTSIQVGQETVVYVRNNSGAQINDGTPVYITGAIGQLPTIGLASASAKETTCLLGLATHDIANNSNGFVTISGEVRGLNTGAYTDGLELYLGITPGTFSATSPAFPNFAISVGVVEHAHNTQGKILVRPGLRANNHVVLEHLAIRTDFRAPVAKIGNIEGGNYSEFEADGTYVAKGEATVFRDELPSYLVPAAGGAAPDSVAHTIGGVARQLYSFDGAATVEILSGSFEIPHDWKVGSEIEVHIHWRPSTTGTGNVEWHFDWEYSPPQGAPVPKTTLSGVATIPSNQQYWHKLDQIGLINATGFSLGGKIGFNLRRSPAGVKDTYGADALLEQIAMHVEIDTLGSRQRYIK